MQNFKLVLLLLMTIVSGSMWAQTSDAGTGGESTSEDADLDNAAPTATEVFVGENTIEILSKAGNNDSKPDSYNLFKFVAPSSGNAHIYTQGEQDTYGQLFMLINQNPVPFGRCEDNYDGQNFNIDYKVIQGRTYYIGVREHSGNEIGSYTLVIKIDDPEPKPFNLVTEDETGEIYEIPLLTAFRAFRDGLGIDDFEQYLDLANLQIKHVNVAYKRKVTSSKWGTVILPYELKSNDKVAYYELTEADLPNCKLEFAKVETVAPNTPTVFRILSGNQYDASTEEPVVVQLPEGTLEGKFDLYAKTQVDGWYMNGWYMAETIDVHTYEYAFASEYNAGDPGIVYISGDKFYHATGTVNMNPYRAIFEAYCIDWSTGLAITFYDGDSALSIQTIMGDDGEFVDIEGIYDLGGSKIRQFQKGFNFYRTPDGKTHKMFHY